MQLTASSRLPRLTSAPPASSARTHSLCPFWQARKRGLPPRAVRACTSAPAAIKASTIGRCPLPAAHRSCVSCEPLTERASLSAPAANNMRQISK